MRAELDNILNDFIPLTFDYSTAVSAHKVLKKILKIQCALAKVSEYRLPMIDKSLLRIANTPETNFLVQAELNAIKKGLKYEEIENEKGEKYKGYVNQDGQREGVGIVISPRGSKDIGEFHLNKLHGTVKRSFTRTTIWGEYKDDMIEGYATSENYFGYKTFG